MSLAKRNNGCLECRTRRVICDKAEPECFKCRKKGIKCSGQGIECRFSPYMRKKASAAKVEASTGRSADGDAAARPGASTTNDPTSTATRTASSKQYLWVDPEPIPGSSPRATLVVPKMEQDPDSTALADAPAYRSATSPSSSTSSHTDETHDPDIKGKRMSPTRNVKAGNHLLVRRPSVQRDPWSYGPGVTIESISSDSRFFFDHFSNFIASKMVALDFHGNGYRQIILPIATQDPMVSQAVSVVSAFHLSQAVPSLRMEAEVGQQRVLSRLRQSALNPDPDQFFKLSNWVTILVLLVGDTITGSSNYVYLLDLLSRLSRAALSDRSLPDDVKDFVQQQTRMFEVFGTPLSRPDKALEMLRRRSGGDLFSFMSYCPYSTAEQRAFADAITSVMRQASRVFEARASRTATPAGSAAAVGRMRRAVARMDLGRDGSHALVWPLFVAAAESARPEHRAFFAARLERLFANTRFGSIPVALDALRYIWGKGPTASWTDVVARERQVLIM